MIGKDKNKWGSENALPPHKAGLKAKSKILVLGLILVAVIAVGFFEPFSSANDVIINL